MSGIADRSGPKLCIRRGPCGEILLKDNELWFRGQYSEWDLKIDIIVKRKLPATTEAMKSVAAGWFLGGAVGVGLALANNNRLNEIYEVEINLDGMSQIGTLEIPLNETDLWQEILKLP